MILKTRFGIFRTFKNTVKTRVVGKKINTVLCNA